MFICVDGDNLPLAITVSVVVYEFTERLLLPPAARSPATFNEFSAASSSSPRRKRRRAGSPQLTGSMWTVSAQRAQRLEPGLFHFFTGVSRWGGAPFCGRNTELKTPNGGTPNLPNQKKNE